MKVVKMPKSHKSCKNVKKRYQSHEKITYQSVVMEVVKVIKKSYIQIVIQFTFSRNFLLNCDKDEKKEKNILKKKGKSHIILFGDNKSHEKVEKAKNLQKRHENHKNCENCENVEKVTFCLMVIKVMKML